MNAELFFRSGAAADLILAVLAGELVVRAVLRIRNGRGVSIANSFWRIAPGACLVVALRLALTSAAWHWLALALAAAGLCHLVDAIRRARSPAGDQ